MYVSETRHGLPSDHKTVNVVPATAGMISICPDKCVEQCAYPERTFCILQSLCFPGGVQQHKSEQCPF